jgi:hypothetical protein
MELINYFEQQGKKNAHSIQALKLIEKFYPDIDYKNNLNQSQFITQVFDNIEKKFKPSNTTRGAIFEYLIMCVFFKNDIKPFFYQAELSFVPNLKFDFILFDTNKNPIIISVKTSSGERYKQVELESYVAKQVHKKCKCVFITYDNESIRFIDRKKQLSEIVYIDEAYSAKEKKFNDFIKRLSNLDYIHPEKIDYIKEGIFLGG